MEPANKQAEAEGSPGQFLFRLPSERKPDIFDREDFQAIKFINQIYPDGTSWPATFSGCTHFGSSGAWPDLE